MIARNNSWVAARLDGLRKLRWMPAIVSNGADEFEWGVGAFFWFRDNRHWLSLWDTNVETGFLIRSVQNAKYRRLIHFPYPFKNARASLLGITNTNSALLTGCDLLNKPSGLTEQAEMSSYPLSGNSHTVYRYTILLPEIAQICELKLSPQGDKLIWFLQPDPGRKGNPHINVWLSDKLGRKFSRLYTLPSYMTVDEVHDVRWNPKGSLVGFVANNALWAISISQLTNSK